MSKPAPSKSETQALQFLWEMGSATVAELHARICESGEVAYTTVLKRVQRMETKGLIRRASSQGRAICYTPVAKPDATRNSLMNSLIDAAFDSSPKALIQHAIGAHKLSPKEIAEIRALLDDIERQG